MSKLFWGGCKTCSHLYRISALCYFQICQSGKCDVWFGVYIQQLLEIVWECVIVRNSKQHLKSIISLKSIVSKVLANLAVGIEKLVLPLQPWSLLSHRKRMIRKYPAPALSALSDATDLAWALFCAAMGGDAERQHSLNCLDLVSSSEIKRLSSSMPLDTFSTGLLMPGTMTLRTLAQAYSEQAFSPSSLLAKLSVGSFHGNSLWRR